MQRIKLPGRTSSEIYQAYTLSLDRDMFYKTSWINTDIEAATILRISTRGVNVHLLRLVRSASKHDSASQHFTSKNTYLSQVDVPPSTRSTTSNLIHTSKSSPFLQTTHMDYSALLTIETFIMFIFLLPFYIVFFFMIV
jgi:hypothetical protein